MTGKTSSKCSFLLVASLVLAVPLASRATTPIDTCPAGDISYVGSGSTVTATIAVAANFTTTLTHWLNTYFLSSSYNPYYNASYYPGYLFEICSDSTGNLEAMITSTTAPHINPILFFAADETAINYGSSYLEYALGYPVLMGYTGGNNGAGTAVTKAIGSVGDLISGLTGGSQNIPASGSSLSSYALSNTPKSHTNGTGLLIADPTLAPYGLAAAKILDVIAGTSISTGGSAPSWMKPLNTYSSITKAYNKIGVDTYTGFAAYSLICNNLPSNAYWVKITDSAYLTEQDVSYLSAYDTNSHTPGHDMFRLISREMSDHSPQSATTWYGIVTANGCYAGF